MTQARQETIQELLRKLGLSGRIECRLNRFGDRLTIRANGEYLGIWDLVKQTWVD